VPQKDSLLCAPLMDITMWVILDVYAAITLIWPKAARFTLKELSCAEIMTDLSRVEFDASILGSQVDEMNMVAAHSCSSGVW